MKIFNKKNISYFLIFLMILHTTSCNYYKVKEVAPNDVPSIQNIGKLHKTMFVHAGKETFIMTDIQVDSVLLTGKLENADSTAYYYYKHHYNQRYAAKEKKILNEVHFYLKSGDIHPPFAEIPLNDIDEIKIIEPDSGRTVASYVFTTVGVLAGVFAILLVIIALTKSSCPYVYVYDGEAYIFEGETFGGAIAQNLERDDYMPLPDIRGNHGQYKIRISNELKEIQHTDLAELVVVNHPIKSEVLLDRKGTPHLLTNKITASGATSENGEHLLTALEKKDRNVFLFNELNNTSNKVLMTFNKPSGISTGNLVLSAKNTLWFDYIFGEFLGKFGSAYTSWMKKQSTMLGEERLKKISENNFPLSIYIRKNNSWQLVEEIMTVGPLAYRDFVIPIDLSNFTENEIEVKIETGFMFWELDAVAIDFTTEGIEPMKIVKPTLATGTGAKDWTRSLMYADQDYMVQPVPGEVTELSYNVKPAGIGYKQSAFLHTRGYYTLIRDFNGLPEFSELNKFKTPGHFSYFSKSNYINMLENEENLICYSSQN